jgi:hypothetical protein
MSAVSSRLCGTLTFRLGTLGQSWFGVRLVHVGVITGSTKNLAAEITLLGMHITDVRSAIGALRFGCPLAGIAVGIFYAAHQDDLTITGRRHSETLTNFSKNRADVFVAPASRRLFESSQAEATGGRRCGRMGFGND